MGRRATWPPLACVALVLPCRGVGFGPRMPCMWPHPATTPQPLRNAGTAVSWARHSKRERHCLDTDSPAPCKPPFMSWQHAAPFLSRRCTTLKLGWQHTLDPLARSTWQHTHSLGQAHAGAHSLGQAYAATAWCWPMDGMPMACQAERGCRPCTARRRHGYPRKHGRLAGEPAAAKCAHDRCQVAVPLGSKRTGQQLGKRQQAASTMHGPWCLWEGGAPGQRVARRQHTCGTHTRSWAKGGPQAAHLPHARTHSWTVLAGGCFACVLRAVPVGGGSGSGALLNAGRGAGEGCAPRSGSRRCGGLLWGQRGEGAAGGPKRKDSCCSARAGGRAPSCGGGPASSSGATCACTAGSAWLV